MKSAGSVARSRNCVKQQSPAGTDLINARIRALQPRKSAYELRDGKLREFGVSGLPSGGKRFFVHCLHRGERV